MSGITHVSDTTFQEEVLEAAQPVLVDFWADWCGPCRMLAPVLEELSGAYSGKLKVAKLNVDQNQETAVRYGVMSIPTLILFGGGKEVKRLVGYQPREQLAKQLDLLLA